MKENHAILVVGGGISGITSALEAAEAGAKVFLVEKSPWLGGRVAALNKYFPKMCPPTCGLEINFRRIRNNPNITIYTDAEVESLSGGAGNYEASIKLKPRYINDKCTACGDCVEACTAERVDDFNYGLKKTKAVYMAHSMAFPAKYAFDHSCDVSSLKPCVDKCKVGAINLDAKEEKVTVKVDGVVVATGWKPYDMSKLDLLGGGKLSNVISNVMMERVTAHEGPTEGKLVRPSDGKEIKSVSFVQCAGSRDENHLPYCSAVCCMASLKQATDILTVSPETEINIHYIDIRAPGRYEDFFQKLQDEGKVNLIKGKVAKIDQNASGSVTVESEDVDGGKLTRKEVDLVVLATGLVPQGKDLPFKVETDDYGFVKAGVHAAIAAAGCAKRPISVAASVRDATGAALLAMSKEGR